MTALLVGAVIATLWAFDQTLALGALVIVAVWFGLHRRVRLAPRKPSTRRWTPALGLAVTPVGFFPFFTITRRRR